LSPHQRQQICLVTRGMIAEARRPAKARVTAAAQKRERESLSAMRNVTRLRATRTEKYTSRDIGDAVASAWRRPAQHGVVRYGASPAKRYDADDAQRFVQGAMLLFHAPARDVCARGRRRAVAFAASHARRAGR